MNALFTKEAIYKKTSQEITSLLYESLINNLELAITKINDKEFVEANESLKKSNDILQRLGVGINYEAGIIADQLDALYNYLADRLIEANLKKDVSIIEEVLNVVTTIASAWNQALVEGKDTQPQGNRRKALAYEQHVLTENNL